MGHSFGFEVKKNFYDKELNANILKELRVWEFTTMTTWGANELALQVDAKSKSNLLTEIKVFENMINSELPTNRKIQFEKQLNELKKHLQPSTFTEKPDTPKISKSNLSLLI